jgi:hypothetical protein
MARRGYVIGVEGIRRHGVFTPLAVGSAKPTIVLMNLLVVLIVVMLLLGGGGIMVGGPLIGGTGFGLILLFLLALYFTGNLSKSSFNPGN